MNVQDPHQDFHQLLANFAALTPDATIQLEGEEIRVISKAPKATDARTCSVINRLLVTNQAHVGQEDLPGLLKLKQHLLTSVSQNSELSPTVQTIEQLLQSRPLLPFYLALQGNCRAVCAFVEYLHSAPDAAALLPSFFTNSTQAAKATFWLHIITKGWTGDFLPILLQTGDTPYDLIFDATLLFSIAPYTLSNKTKAVTESDQLQEFKKLISALPHVRSIVISSLDKPQKAPIELLQAINKASRLQELCLSAFTEVDLATLNLSNFRALRSLSLPMKRHEVELLTGGNLLKGMPFLTQLNCTTSDPSLLATPRVLELLGDGNKLPIDVCGHLFEQPHSSWDVLGGIKRAKIVQQGDTKQEIVAKCSQPEAARNNLEELQLIADEPLDSQMASLLLSTFQNIQSLTLQAPSVTPTQDFTQLTSQLQKLTRLDQLTLCCSEPSFVKLLEVVLGQLDSLSIDLSTETEQLIIALFEKHGSNLHLTSLSVTLDAQAFSERLIQAIAKVPTLKSLHLKGKNLSDSCVDALTTSQTLEELSIVFPKRQHARDIALSFQINRLERLASMPHLRKCSITNNLSISYAQCYQVAQHVPTLELGFRRLDRLPQPSDLPSQETNFKVLFQKNLRL